MITTAEEATNSMDSSEKASFTDQEAQSPPKPITFPEGGRQGWLVVLGCFAVMFFTFGYINAFGIYEIYYLEHTLHDESPSTIAWIGSVQLFFQFSAGLLSGPLTDRFGSQVIVYPSSILFVLSIMITSLCKSYYQFLLAQGILGGLANGLVYTPAVAVLGQYFFRRRPLAMGIASSGSSLGGIIFPIMLNRLLNHSDLGFPWTLRIVGFLVLGLAIVACLTVVPRKNLPKRKGNYLLLSKFKKPEYSLQVVGTFLVFWGLFTPFFYLPTYSTAHGIDQDLAFYTLSILNAGSLVGRLISGVIAPKIGRFNILTVSSAASGILILCWLRIHSEAGIIVFAILSGFTSGFVIAQFPTTLAAVAENPNEIGSLIGMALGIYGIAGLTGAPITGAMIAQYGGYKEAIIFSGVVVIAGSAFILLARMKIVGKGVW
ncbi:MFS transporter, MCP family, solute carrier family 16, member 10, partial [Xylogone sp. PMI_703]